MLVADDDHFRVEGVLAAIKRQVFFARLGLADNDIAIDLVGVIGVQRPADVDHHIVGDIDQRRDRPQTDGDQAVLHPLRAGTVFDPPEVAAGD